MKLIKMVKLIKCKCIWTPF